MNFKANKALHLTAIPLRSIASRLCGAPGAPQLAVGSSALALHLQIRDNFAVNSFPVLFCNRKAQICQALARSSSRQINQAMPVGATHSAPLNQAMPAAPGLPQAKRA